MRARLGTVLTNRPRGVRRRQCRESDERGRCPVVGGGAAREARELRVAARDELRERPPPEGPLVEAPEDAIADGELRRAALGDDPGEIEPAALGEAPPAE